jgi:hypothetical protein
MEDDHKLFHEIVDAILDDKGIKDDPVAVLLINLVEANKYAKKTKEVRLATILALGAVREFIDCYDGARENDALNLISNLRNALVDLEKGAVNEIFHPKKVNVRPPSTSEHSQLRGLSSVCMTYLMKGEGYNRENASKWVANKLNQHGWSLKYHGHFLEGKTIIGWRNAVMQGLPKPEGDLAAYFYNEYKDLYKDQEDSPMALAIKLIDYLKNRYHPESEKQKILRLISETKEDL